MQVTCETKRVGDVEVFYRKAGSPDVPVVLLLHSFLTSSHMFRDLIAALADRYRVIAPDLPGFGHTLVPDGTAYRYRFDRPAEMIDRTNVALYPRFQAYFRKYQPPLMAVWSSKDPFFILPGAEAYRHDLPDAEIHFLDTGHFALETHHSEIAVIMHCFLGNSGSGP